MSELRSHGYTPRYPRCRESRERQDERNGAHKQDRARAASKRRRMSERDESATEPTPPPGGGVTDAALCVLLACFDGAKQASKVRGALAKEIHADGGAILDEVILRLSAKRRRQAGDGIVNVVALLGPAHRHLLIAR